MSRFTAIISDLIVPRLAILVSSSQVTAVALEIDAGFGLEPLLPSNNRAIPSV